MGKEDKQRPVNAPKNEETTRPKQIQKDTKSSQVVPKQIQEPDVGCTKIYYPKLLKAEFKKLIPFLHEGQDREQKPLSMLRGIHLQDLIFYLGTITKNYMLCSEGWTAPKRNLLNVSAMIYFTGEFFYLSTEWFRYIRKKYLTPSYMLQLAPGILLS